MIDYLVNTFSWFYTPPAEIKMSQLPSEIIGIILGEVREPHTTSLVCKKWKAAEESTDFVLKMIYNQKGLAYFLFMAKSFTSQPKEQVERIKGMLERKHLVSESEKKWVSGASPLKAIQFYAQLENTNNLLKLCKAIKADVDFSASVPHERTAKMRSWLLENRDIKELTLSDNDLTEIPEEVNLLTSLETLSIRSTRLIRIPENFGKTLTHLKSLTISRTQVTELPHDFGLEWKELESLDLGLNKLSKLPDTFCTSWPSLKYLHLNNNKLESVPEKFGEPWTKLWSVYIGGNNLSTMPNHFLEKALKIRTFNY